MPEVGDPSRNVASTLNRSVHDRLHLARTVGDFATRRDVAAAVSKALRASLDARNSTKRVASGFSGLRETRTSEYSIGGPAAGGTS